MLVLAAILDFIIDVVQSHFSCYFLVYLTEFHGILAVYAKKAKTLSCFEVALTLLGSAQRHAKVNTQSEFINNVKLFWPTKCYWPIRIYTYIRIRIYHCPRYLSRTVFLSIQNLRVYAVHTNLAKSFLHANHAF